MGTSIVLGDTLKTSYSMHTYLQHIFVFIFLFHPQIDLGDLLDEMSLGDAPKVTAVKPAAASKGSIPLADENQPLPTIVEDVLPDDPDL